MLADGRVVFVNACQHADLYRALRGGGPGYSVVLGMTIKAHPNVGAVVVNKLTLAPKQKPETNSDLLDAIAVLIQSYPGLNDAGFAGYRHWHKLKVEEKYVTYNDYWSFYDTELGLYNPEGNTYIMTSRMLDRGSVKDFARVRESTEVVSGQPDEYAAHVVLLVSGGQVYQDGRDKNSGLHPAWRTSPVVIATYRVPEKTITNAQRQAANHDMTFVKGAAGKKLAPNTGSYMNEGDVNDPDFQDTFYGANYASHLATKHKYDPWGVFYCPSCVGSEAFVNRPDGPLCRVSYADLGGPKRASGREGYLNAGTEGVKASKRGQKVHS
ncbi:hypothetical protein P170DRAFT_436072 [Aspergillus steynii IBT 23096]|uniref:Berberine/berberine-like domain-containing protein n=1 Tax=Aspergillus steynii IBT 23096 TaxID=1392250 RepID=A0A2I2GDQ2_9EURO|nr:uncharacterized protein P170DRAFT_436072 [Aspergillus steynii IBT 23096]PLB50993.1 hypothetical protein P170DRAFT_436072 [Aspergillus steynii IBT 23096]